MNLDHDFFPLSIFSEDQKQVFPTLEAFFSPNSTEDQRSDVDQSQIIGEDAVKLSPRVSEPLAGHKQGFH